MTSRLNAEAEESRRLVDAIREVLGLAPLYASDADPSRDHLVERTLPYGYLSTPVLVLRNDATSLRLELEARQVLHPSSGPKPNAARPRVRRRPLHF